MDPLSGFFLFASEALRFLNTIASSQPPEVQRQLWEWYVKDLAFWRLALKIDKPPGES